MSRFRGDKFDILFLVIVSVSQCCHCLLIGDFQSSGTSDWKEVSDSITHKGESIASFVKRSIKEGQNAILFTLLVPCEHKGAFAGILKPVSLDIRGKSNVVLRIKSHQGNYRGYEFIIRHDGDFGDALPSYVTYFKAPENQSFGEISLPIDDFQAYRRGQLVPGYKPLNKSNVTTVGILAYGGSHRPEKQSGVAALEIEWIRID